MRTALNHQLTALTLAALVIASTSACGHSPSTSLNGGSQHQGLQVGPDALVTTATYVVTGPNDFASAGTVPVGESPDVNVTLNSLPVGQGYEVALDATASDGVTQCQGTTQFDVTQPNATVTVTVTLSCAVPVGDVAVEATLNICPQIDGVDAGPTTVAVGGTSVLTMTAHDSDNQPAPLSYGWSVNGARIPRQTTTTLRFVCSSKGDVSVAAIVSDGDPTPGCADTVSTKVSCE